MAKAYSELYLTEKGTRREVDYLIAKEGKLAHIGNSLIILGKYENGRETGILLYKIKEITLPHKK